MSSRHAMMAATALIAIILCSPAVAQDIKSTEASANAAKTDEADKGDEATLVDTVIVKGIRGSLDAATKRKKNSAWVHARCRTMNGAPSKIACA